MKANELRIDNILNYIWRYNSIYQGKITNISPGKVVFDHRSPIKYDNIIPIPLTEGWLIKFGFEKTYGILTIHIKIDYRLAFNTYSGVFFYCHKTHAVPINDILYIHQLQNLYFELTGKELVNTEIK